MRRPYGSGLTWTTGKVLEDDNKIATYDIKETDFLVMMVKKVLASLTSDGPAQRCTGYRPCHSHHRCRSRSGSRSSGPRRSRFGSCCPGVRTRCARRWRCCRRCRRSIGRPRRSD